jgi:hypothetical protein
MGCDVTERGDVVVDGVSMVVTGIVVVAAEDGLTGGMVIGVPVVIWAHSLVEFFFV